MTHNMLPVTILMLFYVYQRRIGFLRITTHKAQMAVVNERSVLTWSLCLIKGQKIVLFISSIIHPVGNLDLWSQQFHSNPRISTLKGVKGKVWESAKWSVPYLIGLKILFLKLKLPTSNRFWVLISLWNQHFTFWVYFLTGMTDKNSKSLLRILLQKKKKKNEDMGRIWTMPELKSLLSLSFF